MGLVHERSRPYGKVAPPEGRGSLVSRHININLLQATALASQIITQTNVNAPFYALCHRAYARMDERRRMSMDTRRHLKVERTVCHSISLDFPRSSLPPSRRSTTELLPAIIPTACHAMTI
jgi:hypothetical protein